MIQNSSRSWVLLLSLGVLLVVAEARAQNAPPAQPAPRSAKRAKAQPKAAKPEPVLEPKALDILKAASGRLAAAHAMSFTAVISYESPSRLGPPLVYTVRDDVTLLRPDKLRVITPGDGPASEFYYDGKTMMAFEPAANLVAVADAPPTIDAALKAAYDSAAIYYPFTDMIVADPYAEVTDGLQAAFYIGQSTVVGGVTTDMVAIENNWVFEQIWIGADDKLPRLARAVFLADPMGLHHQIEFSNWQIDSAVAAEAFASSKAQAAQRIAFRRPDPVVPPAIKPAAKKKSSGAK